jgi:SAM-dependent methyltransferase
MKSKKDEPVMIVDYVCSALTPLLEQKPLRHLDVSAGWGHLIRNLKSVFPKLRSEACDYPVAPELGDIPVKRVNLHDGELPYEDNSFDLVTCTEAFEHIENYKPIVREMYRILKPGGLVMISTPNILNFRSRIKFLMEGVYESFDPLPLAKDRGGLAWMRHIHPITYFHLCLALLDAGFERPQSYAGKVQKFSALFFWLTPLFRLRVAASKARRARRGADVPQICEELVSEHNSWNIFTSRTLIVSARKPLYGHSGPSVLESQAAPTFASPKNTVQ